MAWTGKALCQHRGVMGASQGNRGSEDDCVSIKKCECVGQVLACPKKTTVYNDPSDPRDCSEKTKDT